MIRRMNLVVVIAVALLMPPSAFANPHSALTKARAVFRTAKSWHAVEHFSNGRIITLDFVAPDRWRIQLMPNITELLIGSNVYMVRNGQSMKLPIRGGMMSHVIQNAGEQPLDPSVKETARDLGMKTVNGKSAHGYSYTTHGMDVTLYLGSDMLPIEEIVKNGTMTMMIDYSKFNAPITVAP